MSVYDDTFDSMIEHALKVLRSKDADICTFALYHDHESHAVSVCADTLENSQRVIRESNAFARKYFLAAIEQRNLESAALWNSQTGRSFSLGDYQYVSVSRRPIKVPNNSAPFYQAMAKALIRNSDKIAALSRDPEQLVLCCSTRNAEVGLIWLYE